MDASNLDSSAAWRACVSAANTEHFFFVQFDIPSETGPP